MTQDLTGTPDAFPVKFDMPRMTDKGEIQLAEFKAVARDPRNRGLTQLGWFTAGWDVAERLAKAEIDRLQTYIIYTPCPSCGLADPDRRAANCEQCAKARAALGRADS